MCLCVLTEIAEQKLVERNDGILCDSISVRRVIHMRDDEGVSIRSHTREHQQVPGFEVLFPQF